ncbi:MAG: LD-carboxypeptidase [Bacteroides sp.]|nr:LD-carboxypeptidase [Bacteroides sp.]
MNHPILPPFLQAGDKVIIVSPSGKIDRSFLEGAKTRLAGWGLKVAMGRHAAGSHASYAGTIAQRLKDLQAAMDDEQAKVILCSRGGYGAVHLVGKLDFTKFRAHPKWLIGFSDITALHNLFLHEGFATLHAPMARHLTVEPEEDYCTQALRDILFGRFSPDTAGALLTGNRPLLPAVPAAAPATFTYVAPTHKLNRKGVAHGLLCGGNLAVFYGLRGTPYDLPAEGSVLFIEDVGERPHAVERMMYNLKIGGVLEKLSGIIIGHFTEYEENRSLGKELYGALADLLKEYDYPVCFGFPVGHVTMNLPLISGAPVTLEVDKREVRLHFHLPASSDPVSDTLPETSDP